MLFCTKKLLVKLMITIFMKHAYGIIIIALHHHIFEGLQPRTAIPPGPTPLHGSNHLSTVAD